MSGSTGPRRRPDVFHRDRCWPCQEWVALTPVLGVATERAELESFRARTLSASLTVKDLQESLAWYHDGVGFAVDRKYEREGELVAVAA